MLAVLRQPPDPGVRDRAAGEDHGQLPGPVPLVRGRQAPPLPQLGQARRRRAAAAARLQVVRIRTSALGYKLCCCLCLSTFDG